MKTVLAVGCLLLAPSALQAQERLPPETAEKFARIFVKQAANLDNLQLKLQPDASQPYCLIKDELGAMIIPDKRLSAKALEKLDKGIAPLGQLWIRNLTVIAKEQAVPNDQLRVVTISVEDQNHLLPLFLVGVRKKTGNDLELVIYGKDKEPLMLVPLRKAETRQDLPVELEGRAEDNRGILTLNILGKYQAELPLAKQEQ